MCDISLTRTPAADRFGIAPGMNDPWKWGAGKPDLFSLKLPAAKTLTSMSSLFDDLDKIPGDEPNSVEMQHIEPKVDYESDESESHINEVASEPRNGEGNFDDISMSEHEIQYTTYTENKGFDSQASRDDDDDESHNQGEDDGGFNDDSDDSDGAVDHFRPGGCTSDSSDAGTEDNLLEEETL